MTHQPEPILRRVKCSEKLPEKGDSYLTNIGMLGFHLDSKTWSQYNPNLQLHKEVYPEWWTTKEPITAVVLTVEEYNELMNHITTARINLTKEL